MLQHGHTYILYNTCLSIRITDFVRTDAQRKGQGRVRSITGTLVLMIGLTLTTFGGL